MKKVEEIVNSPDLNHYKNLRYDMKDSKRVQLGILSLFLELLEIKFILMTLLIMIMFIEVALNFT